MKPANGERANLNGNDWRVSSFQTVMDEAAVELLIPGVAEFAMSPVAALSLAARLASAAIAGESYHVVGEAVSAPADGQALCAILGPAVEALLGRQMLAARSEQNPKTP